MRTSVVGGAKVPGAYQHLTARSCSRAAVLAAGAVLLALLAPAFSTAATKAVAKRPPPPSVSAPPSKAELDPGVQVNPEIVAAASAAQLYDIARQKDQFAPPPALDALIGKQIKFSMPTRPMYSDGELTFVEFLSQYSDGKDSYPLIRYALRHLSASSYVGVNAYGAKLRVSETKSIIWGVLISNRPYDRMYQYAVRLDPVAAKKVSEGATLVVEGEIQPSKNGRVAGCSDASAQPTVSSPMHTQIHACWTSVRISRIAFVTSSGAVLREWTADSPASGFFSP